MFTHLPTHPPSPACLTHRSGREGSPPAPPHRYGPPLLLLVSELLQQLAEQLPALPPSLTPPLLEACVTGSTLLVPQPLVCALLGPGASTTGMCSAWRCSSTLIPPLASSQAQLVRFHVWVYVHAGALLPAPACRLEGRGAVPPPHHTHTHAHTHTPHTHAHACTRTHARTHAHTRTHTRTHTHTHTLTHTHARTHARTRLVTYALALPCPPTCSAGFCHRVVRYSHPAILPRQ